MTLNDCKLIAVFGEIKTPALVPVGRVEITCFQQAYPTETMGKVIYSHSVRRRTFGEIVKVLASQNGTW